MPDVAVEFEKGARIEQSLHPFARKELPLFALAFDGTLTAGMASLFAEVFQSLELGVG
jgi:hypothetical protein